MNIYSFSINIKSKLAVLIVVLVSLISPVFVEARVDNYTYKERQQRLLLLELIEKLQTQLAALQSQAKETVNESRNHFPYQTTIFTLPVERSYLVRDGRLSFVQGGGIRSIDQKLFTLFKTVVGQARVESSIREWRIFNDEDGDLGAFVELVVGTDQWVVGVNRSGLTDLNNEDQEIYVDLFLHELAHIILYDHFDFSQDFEQNFWTKNDHNHANRISKLDLEERFTFLEDYYENNSNRFVSDYATISSDEDLAETFVSFVREDIPFGNREVDKKIRFFYSDESFREIRDELRYNLEQIN